MVKWGFFWGEMKINLLEEMGEIKFMILVWFSVVGIVEIDIICNSLV